MIAAIYIALGLGVLLAFRIFVEASSPAGAGPTRTTIAALMTFPPLAMAVIAAARLLHRRGLASLLGNGWPLDFLRAVAIMASMHIAFFVIGTLAAHPVMTPNLDPWVWLRLLPLALVLVAIQTLSEELLFRGYLLPQLAARFRSPWIWLLVPALLFGAAHASPRLAGDAWPVLVAAASLYGVIAGDLVRRHGNLGAAWGLHLVNNCAALLVVAQRGELSGLSLWITAAGPEQIAAAPWLVLPELLPLALAWLLLRRPTRR